MIGYGFMGRTHAQSYEELAGSGVACVLLPYTSTEEILAADDVHAISICTPTDTHIALATRALEAGKHVLLEKPVALDSDAVRTLRDAASASNRICMPAHCMRFWPAWPEARDIIRNKTFGRVKSATFRRVSHVPPWNREFYSDIARSGGALFDLHIHDADFVLWTFGEPDALRATGSEMHVVTEYSYPDVTVTAEGIWSLDEVPFEMKYEIVLENAVLDFDVARTPTLIVKSNAEGPAVSIPETSAYTLQAKHFLEVIAGSQQPRVTLDDAIRVTAMLEREKAMVLNP